MYHKFSLNKFKRFNHAVLRSSKNISTNKKKIPNETYNYVFYIFSAAVIGENPKLFGFDFDNPLGSAISEMNN